MSHVRHLLRTPECVCVLLCFVDPILGKSRSRCHSLNQGTWGGRILSTGLNVLAKNRRNWQVNFIVSGLEVAKTRFQTFLRGKSVLFKWKCQIRGFHACGMERGEVLKRYCGWQNEAMLLKQTSKDRTFIHEAGALQQNAWTGVTVS